MNQLSEQADNRPSVIICDNCTDIAKATLEGRHLCAGCLMGALMSASDATLFERLTPLPTEIPPQSPEHRES
ncbi:MAG: hypothetical protein JXR76_18455 [Deltaproteobacteria bacterium]|nr:hypothetical protein [Deltaproteobacteria bacterium]